VVALATGEVAAAARGMLATHPAVTEAPAVVLALLATAKELDGAEDVVEAAVDEAVIVVEGDRVVNVEA